MDSSLRRLLQLLIIVVIFFLIAVIIWLFYCHCRPRRKGDGSSQQPLNTATVPPSRAVGGKYPPFVPKPEGYNEDRARTVPAGPWLPPASARSSFRFKTTNRIRPSAVRVIPLSSPPTTISAPRQAQWARLRM
jgi:hypothetical protein